MPKKRDHGSGGLYYIKSRNLYRGVIDVGFHPDGRRKQASVTSRTKAGARDKLEDLKKQIAETGGVLDRKTTMETWARRYLETIAKPTVRPKTYSLYSSLTNVWVIPVLGRKRVAMIKPSDVHELRKRIVDSSRSSSTALRAYRLLSSMLEAARVEGLCAKNVAEEVTPPKAAANNRGAFSAADAIRILKTAIGDEEMGARWWVVLLSAMRQGEALGLTRDSIDFEAMTINVVWQLQELVFEHGCGDESCGKKIGGHCPERRFRVPDGYEYRQVSGRMCLVRPKSAAGVRSIPMIPQLALALRRHMDATKDRPNPFNLVWALPDGRPILPKQDEQRWRNLLLAAGLISKEDVMPSAKTPTLHWGRHTTATVLMELGVDAKVVGEIVGHGSVAVTRSYQHVSSGAARDAMERLGAHFKDALHPPTS